MIDNLFTKWFEKQFVPSVRKFNRESNLPTQELLVVDNAPFNPSEGELVCGEIKATFLASNVTPLLQQMDKGVFQTTKCSKKKKKSFYEI